MPAGSLCSAACCCAVFQRFFGRFRADLIVFRRFTCCVNVRKGETVIYCVVMVSFALFLVCCVCRCVLCSLLLSAPPFPSLFCHFPPLFLTRCAIVCVCTAITRDSRHKRRNTGGRKYKCPSLLVCLSSCLTPASSLLLQAASSTRRSGSSRLAARPRTPSLSSVAKSASAPSAPVVRRAVCFLWLCVSVAFSFRPRAAAAAAAAAAAGRWQHQVPGAASGVGQLLLGLVLYVLLLFG